MSREVATRARFEDAMRIATGLLPALLGVWGALAEPTAASDEATIQVVGLGFSGIFRGLDTLVSAPFQLVPFGTHAFRAALASAFVTGVAGLLSFDLANAFARAVAQRFWPMRPKLDGERAEISQEGRTVGSREGSGGEARRSKLFASASAVAVLTALLGPAWQVEASTGGGAALGAVLVLSAVSLATREASTAGLRAAALLVGLAVSQEPLVLVLVLAALATGFVASRGWGATLRETAGAERGTLVALVLMGMLPLAIGLLATRRSALLSLPVPLFNGAMGFGTAPPRSFAAVRALFFEELGPVSTALAVAGGLSVLALRARRALTVPVLVTSLASLVAMALAHAPMGHASSSTLAAILLLHVMAAAALVAIVLFVANTKVPFAEASAAMVVVLELALPARAADETSTRRTIGHPQAASIWTEIAFGNAPPASVVLVADPALYRRIVAARATATMRADLVVLPTFAARSRAGMSALSREPKLTALVRDLSLGVSPEELSFAELASARPIMATFDPRWDRALARHFVPLGLASRFELEPRGASDRKSALDAFHPIKNRLVQTIVTSPDAPLMALTAFMLRARALAMAAAGERELLSRALDDLRPFAPDDPTANMLVRRIVTTKGPIEVKDLAP